MHITNTSNPVDFPSWEDMSELEQAQCTYWDMYKDAHGVRPRGIDTSTWTIEKFEEEFESLQKAINANYEQDKEEQARAVEAFERRMAEMITLGAKDAAMALRWIHEAEETSGDNDYLAWTLGLPYRYFA
jgi:hypothetical protein